MTTLILLLALAADPDAGAGMSSVSPVVTPMPTVVPRPPAPTVNEPLMVMLPSGLVVLVLGLPRDAQGGRDAQQAIDALTEARGIVLRATEQARAAPPPKVMVEKPKAARAPPAKKARDP